MGKDACGKKLEIIFSKVPKYRITQAMLNAQRFVLLVQYSSEQIDAALKEFCQKHDIGYEDTSKK